MANSDFLNKLIAFIEPHEGYKQFPYTDSRGYLTIGYGRNLQTKGINKAESISLLTDDINDALNWLSTYSWWSNLSDNRKIAIADMAFNLGAGGFGKFVLLKDALEQEDYQEAANQMKQSDWYKQVGTRGVDDVQLMLQG